MDELDRMDEVTEEHSGKKPKLKKQKGQKKDSSMLKRILALVLTAAMVIGAVVLVVFRDELSIDRLRRWYAYRSADSELDHRFYHGSDPEGSFARTGDGLVTCSGKQLQVFDIRGDATVTRAVTMEKPVVQSEGGWTVVYDAGGKELYLIHEGSLVHTYQPERNQVLLSVRVDAQGWLTVVERAAGYKASVTVYDEMLQPVLTENISSSFITDAILSPNHKELTLVSIGEAATGFQSELQFYRVSDGERSGTCQLKDDVVLDLEWEKNVLWVSSEYGAYRIVDHAVASGYTENTSYLQGSSLDGDGFAVMFYSKYQGGSTGTLTVVNKDGVEGTLPLNEDVLSISAAGDYVAVLTAAELTLYHPDLTVYSEVDNTWSARRVMLGDDGSALLISSESASMYLPE